eukprot:CFRG6014T1
MLRACLSTVSKSLYIRSDIPPVNLLRMISTLTERPAHLYPEEINDVNADVIFFPGGSREPLLDKKLKVWEHGVVSSEQCFPVGSDEKKLEEVLNMVAVGNAASDATWMSESEAAFHPFLFDCAKTRKDATIVTQIFESILGINQKANLANAEVIELGLKQEAQTILEKYIDEGSETAEKIASALFNNLSQISYINVGTDVFNPTMVLFAGRTTRGNIGGLLTFAIQT